ncbi:MAG: hypothetical protein PHP97_00395 [Candidatus Shapirobacteria bacterium]|nr:hypothetical protein [Candidatus Shapirobacteria bacterium]MDD4382841.1 hypothetical protein [Candidatus Shapirobacteria bacterium]
MAQKVFIIYLSKNHTPLAFSEIIQPTNSYEEKIANIKNFLEKENLDIKQVKGCSNISGAIEAFSMVTLDYIEFYNITSNSGFCSPFTIWKYFEYRE